MDTSFPSLSFLGSDFPLTFLVVMGVELAPGTGALAPSDVAAAAVARPATGEPTARSEVSIVALSELDDIAGDRFLVRHNEY